MMMTYDPSTSELEERLRDLIDDAWRDYLWNMHKAFVVTPSIPILFFGDFLRYFASPIRVVTVGLNPSHVEFPASDTFTRFDQARDLQPTAKSEMFYRSYLASLSNYFRANPYKNWFDAYEYLLHGLDGSYYDGARNTAIHTDLCSPLATDPTWSGLSSSEQATLEQWGVAQWHRLIAYLAPDVVLVSIARDKMEKIDFPALGPSKVIHTILRDNPYHVHARRLRIVEDKETHIISGMAAQKPFGKVSNADKRTIGARIREYIDG